MPHLGQIFLVFSLFQKISVEQVNNAFDLLIVAQHWPLTICIDWKSKGKSHKCRLPREHSWSLHGVWPSQLPSKKGVKGPSFCNDSLQFDLSQLGPIMPEMAEFWPDVELPNHHNSLWEHEWTKHGTCAMQLPGIDSQLRYFSKGCELSRVTPIFSWLVNDAILPGRSYTMARVWKALLNATRGFRPRVDCKYINKQHYLAEIKVCYSNNFTLVHCDRAFGRLLGNCPRKHHLRYPSISDVELFKTTKRLRSDRTFNLVTLETLKNKRTAFNAAITAVIITLFAAGIYFCSEYRKCKRHYRGYQNI